MKLIKIFSH